MCQNDEVRENVKIHQNADLVMKKKNTIYNESLDHTFGLSLKLSSQNSLIKASVQ